MPAYCTKADALNWVNPGSVTSPRRQLAAIVPSTDTFVLEDHRLLTGYEVQLWLRGNGEMCAPAVEGVVYYAIELSDSTFQIAATPEAAVAGTPIDITSEGANVHIVAKIPWDAIIERCSSLLDQKIAASSMPIVDGQEVPPIVRRLCSGLAIQEAALFVGRTDLDLKEHMDRLWALLEELRSVPIRDKAPPASMLAIRAPRTSGSATDARGWRRTCNGTEVL